MTAQGWVAMVSILGPVTGAIAYLLKRSADSTAATTTRLLQLAQSTNDSVNHGRMERLEAGVQHLQAALPELSSRLDVMMSDVEVMAKVWEHIVTVGGQRSYDPAAKAED